MDQLAHYGSCNLTEDIVLINIRNAKIRCVIPRSLLTVAAILAFNSPSFALAQNTQWLSHFQAGVNAVAETNLFWNFSDQVAPDAGFDSDTEWLEYYVKPGISFQSPTGGGIFYGKLSGVFSYTQGTDAYDANDTGRGTLEEAYLGYKQQLENKAAIDLSLGPKELKLGSGMLVANGGSSGFERGALKFGPRKAWDTAAIGQFKHAHTTGTLFYISPNELSSNDSDNRLAGFDYRYQTSIVDYAGLSYIKVLESQSPYAQAAFGGVGAPTILPGAREGTNALNIYALNSSMGNNQNLMFSADIAYEWNDRIDLSAWAGRIQTGYVFKDLAWSPLLILSYQTFSGDDPDTDKLERFDPLYYEGSPSAWATGSKSSMTFINSNVQAYNVALRIQPSKQDTLTLRYSHIRANELRSPIQFGQATRVETVGNSSNVISGVTHAHLSDDLFLEYNRIVSQNIFLTAGLSVSFPGKGIRDTFGGHVPNWTGGFVNVVVNY